MSLPHALAASLALASLAPAQFGGHVDQHELTQLVKSGAPGAAFAAAFEAGDELFGAVFLRVDGVGAHVGTGQLFTRVPRADLAGPGEWADHFPPRPTGPNGRSCTACHALPFEDGAGTVVQNVVRDPLRTGRPADFIERQTVHLFASGAVQRLAEEMNEALEAQRAAAAAEALASGRAATVSLTAKGLSFGSLTAVPSAGSPGGVVFDTSAVKGVDADLVPRPFGWKGDRAFLRDFNRNASHNELGLQAVELVGYGVDGDFDGVVDELTVGDLTALAVYNVAQPRPTTEVELARLGLIPPLSAEEAASIRDGWRAFRAIGCAECHVPELSLADPLFREPSANPRYRDAGALPSGLDPTSEGLEAAFPVGFDLTADQPGNRLLDEHGALVFHLGALEPDGHGGAVVRLFGDLRRHDLGAALAEGVDETGAGASVWLTENLWGVGSTAPYLHDGRATTIAEAIAFHGGEAAAARHAFQSLPPSLRVAVERFLQNLVLFVVEE